ncbi:cyclin-dependent kinase C-2 C-like isoform X2 [Apium graveolens]|uniref:cyclin-dependent kinase C-2 C-like isoform X2 n=1 Tax=Apium graveolens TaxID=4045 RepID=UPI003D7B53BB
MGNRFKGSEAELIAAGWPPWMVEDAREALKGVKSFQKLEKIVVSTNSHVYRVLDLEQNDLVTLKRHSTQATPSKHIKIIKLEGVVTSRMSCEYIEHDLAGLASHPGLKFAEPQNHFLANLKSCQSIIQAKSLMLKFEMKQEDKRLGEARVTYMMSKEEES